MLEYDARYRLKTGLSVLPVVLLLTPSRQVMECFEDEGIRYRFRVISLAAMDAKAVFDLGNPCLLPFVALMKGGREFFDQAEKGVYHSSLDRGDKADLLTGMALLSGLVSMELPTLLLKRRKDIMIESAGYKLIKQEGIKEGIKQGIQRGVRQGTLATIRDNVIEVLVLRFDEVPLSILRRLKETDDPDLLKMLLRKALKAESLDAFKSIMIRLLDSEE